MATIISRLDELTDFPTAIDTWTRYRDGQDAAAATNAEIVNKLEAAIYRTQEYNQKTIRVLESRSVTGDRRRLKLYTPIYIDGGSDNKKPYHEYDLQLGASEASFLGGVPFRAGNVILVSVVRRDAGGAQYRAMATPVSADKLRIYIDNLDPSGYVTTGTYHLQVTIIGG